MLFDEVAQSENARLARRRARPRSWTRRALSRGRAMSSARTRPCLPGFVPEFVESAFGTTCRSRSPGTHSTGRIDRVDTSSASVFVTDYKSSRDVSGWRSSRPKAKMQAVIYACAAEQITGASDGRLRVPLDAQRPAARILARGPARRDASGDVRGRPLGCRWVRRARRANRR